jgi:hypothetical protein
MGRAGWVEIEMSRNTTKRNKGSRTAPAKASADFLKFGTSGHTVPKDACRPQGGDSV